MTSPKPVKAVLAAWQQTDMNERGNLRIENPALYDALMLLQLSTEVPTA